VWRFVISAFLFGHGAIVAAQATGVPDNEAGTAGKTGKPRARKSREKKESPEDE
jgi:hypothetical protein